MGNNGESYTRNPTYQALTRTLANQKVHFAIGKSEIRFIYVIPLDYGLMHKVMWRITVVNSKEPEKEFKELTDFFKRHHEKSKNMMIEDPSILSADSVAEWEAQKSEAVEEKWDDRRAEDLAKSLPPGTKVEVQGESEMGVVVSHVSGSYLPEVTVRFRSGKEKTVSLKDVTRRSTQTVVRDRRL